MFSIGSQVYCRTTGQGGTIIALQGSGFLIDWDVPAGRQPAYSTRSASDLALLSA